MGALEDFLPKVPGRARWEGWFLIGIGAGSQKIRWTKTHFYRHNPFLALQPLSKLEGMSAPGEILTYVATGEQIFEHRETLRDGSLDMKGNGGFSLAVPGRWELKGNHPRYTMLRRAATGERIELTAEARDRISWLKAGGLLTYFGYHSDLEGTIGLGGGEEEDFFGLGVVEHAWGGVVPFDPNLFVRGPWHWDVLSFEHVGKEIVRDGAALAALSVPVPLKGPRGVRARGRLPGGKLVNFSRFRVEHLVFGEENQRGVPVRYPTRWRGQLESADGKLVYEARATTPLARAVETGGFLGFRFEGSLSDSRREERLVSGNGFTEFGSPTWRL